MPGPTIEWTDPGPNAIPTTTPVTGDMPDLSNETGPAADNGSPQRVSQVNELRDVVIENRRKLVQPVTRSPHGALASTTSVNFTAKPGQPATVRLQLSDGIVRSFTGTLLWDNANGVGNLGWDEAASQAAGDKWIQFYAVDDGSGGITIKASDNPVSVGPAGGVAFEHVWSTRRVGGLLTHVEQVGNEFYRVNESVVYNLSNAGDDGSFVSVDLSAFVPVEANMVFANARIRGRSGEDWQHSFSWNTASTYLKIRDTGNAYPIIYQRDIVLPIVTPQTIYRWVRWIAGSGPTTVLSATLWVIGWRSASVKP